MTYDMIFRLALAYEREANYAEALKHFQECFAEPMFDEGDLCFHCAWCLECDGKSEQAFAFYERSAELTRIPTCKLNSYFRSGWILMSEKDFVKAADRFRLAIDYGDVVDLKNETYARTAYWYAFCLECRERYFDALKWYRYVEGLMPTLDPESRFRQIVCLNYIGLFGEALRMCSTFEAPSPETFDVQRYEILRMEVRKEREVLEVCLLPFTANRKVSVANGIC